LAVGETLACRGLQHLQFPLIMRRAHVNHPPPPARFEYTICTAVAPDAVFTVRTYATAAEATRSS
jgi:hypothetical protein